MPGQSIFVTDDDATYLEIVTEVLHDAGYPQVTFQSGKGAYHGVRKAMPDLILLDISPVNPGQGWQTLSVLKMHPATTTIPIILCVLDIHILEGKDALLEEMNCRVLEKPFDRTMLVTAVQAILGPPA